MRLGTRDEEVLSAMNTLDPAAGPPGRHRGDEQPERAREHWWKPAAWWALLGLLLTFGVASLASIGWFVLAGALALGVVLAVRRTSPRSSPALLIGGALTPLYLAAANLGGPGLTCSRAPASSACTDLFNPVPFALAGIALLIIGGALLFALQRR